MILNGKVIKDKILNELKEKVSNNNLNIGLAIIQIGSDYASEIYIREKKKMCDYVGYNFYHYKYDSNVIKKEIIDIINELNNDKNIHGILVQLPIPKFLDKDRIINSIDYKKDVDSLRDNNPYFIHCTPLGILNLIDYYKIDVVNKNIVVIGKSNLVGKPISKLLIERGSNVIICDSKTNNLSEYTRCADIIIIAIGKAKFLTKDMIKENSIIIDVGINRVDNKLYGDVDFDDVKDKVSMITPVPGGIGPMTISALALNLYKAYELNKKEDEDR